MTYRVGDSVFLSNARPAIIERKDAESGKLIVDQDPAAVRQATRHGYLNGVEPERRQELMSILDEVKALGEPGKRIEDLQRRIDEMSVDPKNIWFVRYLEAEKGHLMNMSGYKPRFYQTEEHKMR